MNLFKIYALLTVGLFISACNLEQEIELELPEYEKQKVVECYLEPGQPFTLLLTESDAFFNAFPTLDDQFLENIMIADARVTISYGTEVVELENEVFFNPFTGKVANYVASGVTVPEDFDSEFKLEIETSDNQKITASTFIKKPVPIDSLVVQFNEATDTVLARVLTYVTDNSAEANFYRRILAFGTDEEVEQDFVVDDELLESEVSVFGTNFRYEIGDTVTSNFMHISEDYFRFVNSVDDAVDSNGNPFGQPGVIISNLEGDGEPIGIFTGFVQDIQSVIITE